MAKKIEQAASVGSDAAHYISVDASTVAHQVTLNEAVEAATGEPTPPDTLPIKQPDPEPKKTRSKPGENRVLVTLDDNDYHNLVESADGRKLNDWLDRLLSGRIVALAEQYAKER